MTEADWYATTDSMPMLAFVRDLGSNDRKFRLFAVACCRRLGPLMDDDRSRVALDLAEGPVTAGDGEVWVWTYRQAQRASRELDPNRSAGTRGADGLGRWHARCCAAMTLLETVREAVLVVAGRAAMAAGGTVRRIGRTPDTEAERAELAAQAGLVRCVFGNPFRPSTLAPSCLTPTVAALARQMYETRDFSALPILADALQDAGCEDAELLGHFRGPGPHVRGCFALDLVLGKE